VKFAVEIKMGDESDEVDLTTLSKKQLVEEVLRLRQQISEDQDHYRKCRDMMAEKLQNYNDKFNLQEEAIHYLDEQLKSKTTSQAGENTYHNREVARVPEFPRQAPLILPAFKPQ
jgi:hypothetical protein